MTSDLAKLMEYIDKLQTEATPEPIVESVKPKRHPLLEAMQSLKDEGIIESVVQESLEIDIEEEIAYHGTTDDIVEFHPFTHFGTEKAAKDRVEYKKIKDGKIYKVDLDIKNPLKIKDFPGIHYDRLYAFELKDKGLISQDEMEDITFTQDKNELRKKLLAKLSELGIDGFVYKNRYEDKGNISYVIVDPSQVKVLSVEPATEEVTEDVGGNYLYHATSAGGLKAILQSGQVNAASGPQVVTRAQTKMPTVSMTRDWGYASGKTATQQMAGIGRDAILVFDRSRIENNFKTLGTSQSSDVRGLAYNPNFGGKEQNQSVQARAIAKKKYDYAQQSDPETKAAYTSPKAGGEFEEAIVVPKGALPIKGTLIGFYVNPKSQLVKDASIMNNPLRLEKTGPNKFVSANQKVAETISTGQGGGSAGNGGAQMVGGPTTYEEEYGMFKSKGPRRIMSMTEALDSSYPYEEYSMGKYHFVTDSGIKYKVYLQGKDMVEVAFSAILPGEEENFRPDKTTLTGTGDSRKVFGTVVKIVKEYLDTHKPNALYFTAENAEPSRIKLYNRLIAQVDKELPDYKALGNIDLGTGTAYMLKRKTDTVNEALDSSYEYRTSEYAPGQVFYFDTDDGSEYRVEFGRAGKAAEVAFERLGKDNEYKIGLTGTGDSRKIFGTIINIVKDYLAKNNPKLLLFTANNSEPSRVKLYKMLASKVDQALPDYTFAGALNNGTFTQFNINHKSNPNISKLDKVKAAGWKTLDKIVGESAAETTSLDKIYHGMRPDHDEMIWNYVGDSDFDTEFPIETINPTKLGLYLRSQYRIEDLEELFDMMEEDQEILVNHYMKEPNLSNEIIVMYDGKVIDGNHRALAAALTNKPIRYIDIGEEEL